MKSLFNRLLAFGLAALFSTSALAQSENSPVPPRPDGKSPKKTIEDLVKQCKKYDGLFTLYQDTTSGSVFMRVKKDQVGKEFIYFAYTENGIASVGHFRGNFRENRIFSLRRYFDKLEFIGENTEFYFDPANPISKAATANISAAVLASQRIVAEDSAKGFLLIEADNLFLSEALHQVKPSPSPVPSLPGQNFTLGNLSREKSKYISIKNYPKNTDIVVEYTYENPMPMNGGGKDVTDARSVSIRLQHTLLEVPQNSYKPRFDDPRVGFFSTEVNDMTSPSATPYRDVIHRWHLEKKDKSAALSEPVEPIVFWLENTTPTEFRETIRSAVLNWNVAFEAAGFKNAVQVQVQPDDAAWDAGDIRYNVIRWTSSPNPPFGGYGPSFVNPRTGQILGADIMLEYVYFTNRLMQEKLFSTTALGFSEESNGDANALRQPNPQACSFGQHLQMQTLTGLCALKAQGVPDAEMKEFVKSALYYLALHEVGHTLGLTHNMKASQLYSPDEINNKAVTEKTGLIGSVMDYPLVNLSADRTKQGQYFTTIPGPYDRWAIEYGYSEALPDATQEQARVAKLLGRSAEPQLAYGNDADDMRNPGSGIDPRVMIDDMSSDAITYSVGRIKLCNDLQTKILNRYNTPNQSYQELRNAYLVLTGQVASAAGVISRYVGGVYVDRAFIGQAGGTKPYTPVAAADQKRAVDALSKYIFAPDAFHAPAELYNYLQTQRRGFNFGGGTEDPKITDRILNIHRYVLNELLHPNVLKRITDTQFYGNGYALSAYMSDLTNGIFKDDLKGNVNSFRQNLQLEYVNRLITASGVGGSQGSAYSYPAQSVALQNLKSIQKSLAAAATQGNADTQAHRGHILFNIQKALSTDKK